MRRYGSRFHIGFLDSYLASVTPYRAVAALFRNGTSAADLKSLITRSKLVQGLQIDKRHWNEILGCAPLRPKFVSEGAAMCHELRKRGTSASSQEGYRSQAMRLILGMILGAALTVGGAYIADTSKAPGAEQQRMVNWEVVSRNVDTLTSMIKQGWSKLTG
jgi:hypothetical protein